MKPDFVIEAGTLYGGRAPLWAMFLEQFNPEGLDAKTRLLLTLQGLTIQGSVAEPQIRLTVRHAIEAGATKQEVAETIGNAAMFGGVPAMNKAMEGKVREAEVMLKRSDVWRRFRATLGPGNAEQLRAMGAIAWLTQPPKQPQQEQTKDSPFHKKEEKEKGEIRMPAITTTTTRRVLCRNNNRAKRTTTTTTTVIVCQS